MNIAGLQKMTLLDVPGRVACTVFLGGCNYRCPFCHNSGLLSGCGSPAMSRGELTDFLRKRQGMLDGVCVTGGEPTLQPELPELLAEIRSLGYFVKLDTNGSRPDVLKALAAEGLVDYVAMDVKNSPERYAETAGTDASVWEPVRESMAFLLNGGVEYEFRTTVVAGLHDDEAFFGIRRAILENGGRAKKYFIQPFVDRDTVAFAGLSAPSRESMEAWLRILADCTETAAIRGE